MTFIEGDVFFGEALATHRVQCAYSFLLVPRLGRSLIFNKQSSFLAQSSSPPVLPFPAAFSVLFVHI